MKGSEITVARKTSRNRRDSRGRISQAQLQAYRVRKEETTITPRAVVETTEPGAPSPAATTTWGRIEDEYDMIASDLKRLLIISVLMFALIAAFWVILG